MLDLYVSHGNLSESKDITLFNIPAITTCPNHSLCEKACYARKAEWMYKAVRGRREKNYKATKHPNFAKDMIVLLKKDRNKRVRIHESGDFYNLDYINKWKEVIEALPEKTFRAFTKVEDAKRILGPLKNAIIHMSVLPGGEINFGDAEYVTRIANKYSAYICPKKGTREHSCAKVGCDTCWDKSTKYIVFKKH